jgi:hypothetical protein
MNRTRRSRVPLPESTLQSKHDLLQVNPMFTRKPPLPQSVIRIRTLPVMPATKRNSGEVGRFLPYPSGTQSVRVRRFDDGSCLNGMLRGGCECAESE